MTLKPSSASFLMYLLAILCFAMLFCITSNSSPSFVAASPAAPLINLAHSRQTVLSALDVASDSIVEHVAFDNEEEYSHDDLVNKKQLSLVDGHFAPQQTCTPSSAATSRDYYLKAASTDPNGIGYEVIMEQSKNIQITVVCVGTSNTIWARVCRGTTVPIFGDECSDRITLANGDYPVCTYNVAAGLWEWTELLPISPDYFGHGIGVYHVHLQAGKVMYDADDYTYALASASNCGAGIMKLISTPVCPSQPSVLQMDYYLPALQNYANGALILKSGDPMKTTVVCKNSNTIFSIFICKGTLTTTCSNSLGSFQCSYNSATDRNEWTTTTNFRDSSGFFLNQGSGMYHWYVQSGSSKNAQLDYTYATALNSNCKSGIFNWQASTFSWALDSSTTSSCTSSPGALCNAYQTKTTQYKCKSSIDGFVADTACSTSKPSPQTSNCVTAVGCSIAGQTCNSSGICSSGSSSGASWVPTKTTKCEWSTGTTSGCNAAGSVYGADYQCISSAGDASNNCQGTKPTIKVESSCTNPGCSSYFGSCKSMQVETTIDDTRYSFNGLCQNSNFEMPVKTCTPMTSCNNGAGVCVGWYCAPLSTPSPPSWQLDSGSASQCNASFGARCDADQTQTVAYTCQDSSGTNFDDSYCHSSGSKPGPIQRKCNLKVGCELDDQTCNASGVCVSSSSFDWKPSNDITCLEHPYIKGCNSNKYSTKTFICQDANGNNVDDSSCDSSSRPSPGDLVQCVEKIGCSGSQTCNANVYTSDLEYLNGQYVSGQTIDGECLSDNNDNNDDASSSNSTTAMSVQFVVQLIVFAIVGLISVF